MSCSHDGGVLARSLKEKGFRHGISFIIVVCGVTKIVVQQHRNRLGNRCRDHLGHRRNLD